MMYKPSMFNIIHRCSNGNLRLLNSYGGYQSLLEIDSQNSKYVEDLLSQSELNYPECNSEIFNKLIELGYVIPKVINEKLKRALRHNDVINNKELSLILLPTEQCNFRCKYCYEEFTKGKMSEEVQVSIVKFIQKNIQHYTSVHIGWFGGEPTEALDVIENLSGKFMRICKVAKKKYSSSMTTNAYNLSLETFKQLHSLNVLFFQITLDGLKETHDNQRPHMEGHGTFEKIISNLTAIKESMNSQYFHVALRTNFSKDIFDRIDEYIELLNKHFSNDKRFHISLNMAANWGGEKAKEFEGSILKQKFYPDILKEFFDKAENLQVNKHLSELTSSGLLCYANKRNSYVIGSDGSVYKCSRDFTEADNTIGSINKNGEMIIDESKHSLWVSNQNMDSEPCTNCSFSACCFGTSCPSSFVRNQNSRPTCPRVKLFIHDLLEMYNEKAFIKI